MFRTSCLRLSKLKPPLRQCRRAFRVLGIETSCDDTCVSVLDISGTDGSPRIEHNIIRRSLSISEQWGGIVPNLVGQFHAKNLARVLSEVRDAGGFDGLDLIAVTRGPGIPMCLAGGLNTAKGLSVGLNMPIIGVHHMQAHALTPRLLSPTQDPKFPFYTLLISGGHTLLLHSISVKQHTILINTRDTAIGDYIDKVARVLKVPWGDKMPGAALEKYTQINDVTEKTLQSDVEYSELPKPLSVYQKNVMAFSFTGIRSAVERLVEAKGEMQDEEKKSVGRAAQVLGFEHVAEKCVVGIKARDVGFSEGNLVVSGGVASNMAFRKILRQTLDRAGLNGYKIIFPPIEFCTDNAAMIAWAGYEMYREGYISDYDITQKGKWPLDQLMDEDIGWKRHTNTPRKEIERDTH